MNKQRSLASACRRLADLVEARQRPLKAFSQHCVFDTSGRAGCPFGHALVMAGLRPQGVFRWREKKDGAWQPLFLTNEDTYARLLGPPAPALEEALWDLAAYNAAKSEDSSGVTRRHNIALGLRRVAVELDR